jgi:hypothetical protein
MARQAIMMAYNLFITYRVCFIAKHELTEFMLQRYKKLPAGTIIFSQWAVLFNESGIKT